MDLTNRACAFTGSEQRIRLITLGHPAEATLALWILSTHILSCCWHLDELFEFLLVCVCVDAICAVTLFLSRSAVNVHLAISAADFLDSKLDTSNLEDVFFLDLVIL